MVERILSTGGSRIASGHQNQNERKRSNGNRSEPAHLSLHTFPEWVGLPRHKQQGHHVSKLADGQGPGGAVGVARHDHPRHRRSRQSAQRWWRSCLLTWSTSVTLRRTRFLYLWNTCTVASDGWWLDREPRPAW